MNKVGTRTLRTFLQGPLLASSMLAGTALTWGAAWLGLQEISVAFTGCRGAHPPKSMARLRVKAARDATAQYMMDNSSSCPRGIDELVSQKYLDRSNAKDPWGKDLIFHCPGNNDSPSADILSAGPDKQEGTLDDIKSWEL
jgi:hypothetical protein